MSRTDHHRPWPIRAADTVDRVGYFSHSEYWHARYGECHPNWCSWWMSHVQLSHAPRWYAHATWWGPERSRERRHLGEMVKEHRAYGGVEMDFPCWQHRHAAQWSWS